LKHSELVKHEWGLVASGGYNIGQLRCKQVFRNWCCSNHNRQHEQQPSATANMITIWAQGRWVL